MRQPAGQKIAVIGGGVAGLTTAYLLDPRNSVTLFEKNDYIGGHTHTVTLSQGPDKGLNVDTGFIVYNDKNYPTFIRLLARLGIEGIESDMSFGFSNASVEYSSYFPHGIFAQKRNLIKPSFLRMLSDILKFNKQAIKDFYSGRLSDLSLGDYLQKSKTGHAFKNHYLIPMTAAIWSTSPREMLQFPAEMFARFFINHGLLSVGGRPQWKTIPGGSVRYVNQIINHLKGCVYSKQRVLSVKREPSEVRIQTTDGRDHTFDAVVIATHADQALKLLKDPSDDEKKLLGPWSYTKNHAVLHTDESLMPKHKAAWASWNYRSAEGEREQVTLTYYMNLLQKFNASKNYFVTLNAINKIKDEHIICEMNYTHPKFTFDSLNTQEELRKINGQNRTYFCGSYFKYGFHEDAVASAALVAKDFGEIL